VVIFGVASITTGETNIAETGPRAVVHAAAARMADVPMALLGTAAFVAWSNYVNAS